MSKVIAKPERQFYPRSVKSLNTEPGISPVLTLFSR